MKRIDWPPERDAVLTALWAEYLPASEIGTRLGVSKNSVIGRAHRLGLPKRNSPMHARKKPAPPKEKTFSDLLPGQCQYPLGGLLEKPEEWCGKPIYPGKPYCQEHCKLAYAAQPKEPQALLGRTWSVPTMSLPLIKVAGGAT